ncbi:MAG: peptidoglycan editing factor PgeF [Candidatus Eisenbacteria bacterium]|nr:peptidoglycan editing factor PgeF [Candidatus Eisenbacteria bacterium]
MWVLLRDAPLPLWRPVSRDLSPVLAFSTRRGGVSLPPYDQLNLGRSSSDRPEAVAENRRRVLQALGLDRASLVTAGQVHGTTVRRAERPGHIPDCDALITDVPGLALAVTTADCMSLLLVAPGAVAAAHSGWRGTANGIPVATLEALCDRSASPAAGVAVHFGPCIRGCCYEVGPTVAARFPAEAIRDFEGPMMLDLPTAARLQLAAAGVTQIHDTGACTACEPHWYYSHRRDRGACGRHWAVAALTNGAEV